MRPYARLVIALTFSALVSTKAPARPIALPNVQRLTDESNLVVVADIATIHTLGAIEFSDRTKGEQVTATVKVSEVLKGSTDTNVLDLTYDQNPDPMLGGPWTQQLRSGDHMILFLQCSRICHIADPAYAGFSVQAGETEVPAPTQDTPANRVLQHVAVGLFVLVNAATPVDPSRTHSEVFLLSSQPPNPYIDLLLQEALHQLAPNKHLGLRGELLAALIHRGDLSFLPEVHRMLASNLGDPLSQVAMIYALQGVDWHQTLPIVAETLRSSSSEVRVASARAIQNLGRKPYVPPNDFTAPATHLLLTALNDPDSEVAFAVMQSLGYLNGRLDQRPQTTSPDANWRACIQFWSTFPDPTCGSLQSCGTCRRTGR